MGNESLNPKEIEKEPGTGGDDYVEKTGAKASMDHVLMALNETSEDREIRIKTLFSFFDAANAGCLDHKQIEAGLSSLHVPVKNMYAKDLLHVCDANKDGRVDYDEFRQYMDDKELELYRSFQAIDVEHNGGISPQKLWDALVKAGIKIGDKELATFVESVDMNSNGVITFKEWRDFLFLYPHEATIENIYHYVERACFVDIGEITVIPKGISEHIHASRYLIAGAVSGVTSRTATAPLDRLKVVLQVQTSRTQIMPALKTIWKEGGVRGLFRGNGLNVLKVAPESAIKFHAYDMMKKIIGKTIGEEKSEIGGVGCLVAGGAAGAISLTAIYPMDLLKTRIQTQTSHDGKMPNIGKLSKHIWVHEGPRAFYRGLVPSLVGIVPYAGIDFAAYETLKDISKKYIGSDNEPGPLVQVGCGMVSGSLGATCVYPLQVIRTRLQAQRGNTPTAYKGMSDVFWKTIQHEGFQGLYRGIFPNMLKVVPSASVSYMVFESVKKSMALE